MKVAVPLPKHILAPLVMTAVASTSDAGLQEKKSRFWGNNFHNFKWRNNDIMKIAQVLENSNVLLKGVAKTINNETKEQKGGLFGMLSGILGASLLGNLLSGKGMLRAGYGNEKGKGIL